MSGSCDAGCEAWERRFATFLRRSLGPERSASLAERFRAAIGADYRLRVDACEAARDCLMMESLDDADRVEVAVRPARLRGHLHIRFLGRTERALDEFVPWLIHLGLILHDQVQFALELPPHRYYLRRFVVESRLTDGRALLRRRRELTQALRAVASGHLCDDPLNGLVTSTDLAASEVDVLRAYRNYYVQLRGPVFAGRIEQALLHNPQIARILFGYFEARFDPLAGDAVDPAGREETLIEPLRRRLSEALADVVDVDEDHVLRALFNVIDATLRTNHYQRTESPDFALALKIDALGVIDMPPPRPAYEIFVHAEDFEGIHLRGARVARGGIRWSERSTELRAEILDLQQTQMLKNALIVPQGAKGGFVVRNAPAAPEARDIAGRRAYRRFIRALLELTDNAPGYEPQRHARVLAYDESDPYFVVAADKGTAGFSDLANEVATEAGFWLGDAFASGGSQGYSHKRFGITARGAWECLRRHFRELGRDLDREPVTVVGVGSMDGDVFGNGMLMSENIRLLGAFSAHHIFLDPNSEPFSAYRERKRLFDLPRSTWDDYDRSVIGSGGGVHPRSAKRIALSRASREWLGLRYEGVDGEELVRLLLTAPVDLLWFGGIGTFVKSSEESPEEVGDHANDPVRVDAGMLRAKVVGEGANLSFTQRARVEYALAGGRINMDAIDNSGGVDLSDHEVNLKILLAQQATDGTVRGSNAGWRERLLSDVSGEVCAAVISHNADQSLALSLDEARCARRPEPFFELIERFEEMGLVDRKRAAIGSRGEVLGRPRRSLTRPELTQLLAPVKLTLKSALLSAADFFDLGCFEEEYRSYFPERIRSSFAAELGRHPLATEITVSQVCNRIIDRAGATFLTWAEEPSPRILSRAVTLYLLFERTLGAEGLCRAIRRSERIPPDNEIQLLLRVEDALQSLCRWGLTRSRPVVADAATVATWREHWEVFRKAVMTQQSDTDRAVMEASVTAWVDQGLARELAESLGQLEHIEDFPFVVDVQRRTSGTLPECLQRYRRVAAGLGWPEIKRGVSRAGLDDHQQTSLLAIEGRLLDAFARLCVGSITAGYADPAPFLEALRERGLLSRVVRIRQALAGASSSRLIELLVVLMADAEAAADHCDECARSGFTGL